MGLNRKVLGAAIIILAGALCESKGGDQSGNLAPNPGFEMVASADASRPTHWNVFSDPNQPRIVLCEATPRSGQRALRFSALGQRNGHQCGLVTLPVRGGKKYTFGVHVRNDKQDGLNKDAQGQLSIEWLDRQGKELSRVNSEAWSSTLSVLRWTLIAIDKAEPPPGATRAKFVIRICEEGRGGKGSYCADDAWILEE